MNQYDVLQRIPYEQEFTYEDIKESFMYWFEEYLKIGTSIIGCVKTEYNENDMVFSQNGMEKLVLVIAGMLFLIEHDEMDDRIAFSTKWDIMDFETGNYDDLFTLEDLAAIKKDVAILNEYYAKHPELTEGVEEKRRKVQASINYKHKKPNIETKLIMTDYQYDFLKPLIPDLDEFLEKSNYSGLLRRLHDLLFRKYYNNEEIQKPLEEVNKRLYWYNRDLIDIDRSKKIEWPISPKNEGNV